MFNINALIGYEVNFLGNTEIEGFSGIIDDVKKDTDDKFYLTLKDMEDNHYDVSLTEIDLSEENIHLFYELMSDREKMKYSHTVLNSVFHKRMHEICDALDIQKAYLYDAVKAVNTRYYKTNGTVNPDVFNDGKCLHYGSDSGTIEVSYFGVKDTLKPIDEYIIDIRKSDRYKKNITKETEQITTKLSSKKVLFNSEDQSLLTFDLDNLNTLDSEYLEKYREYIELDKHIGMFENIFSIEDAIRDNIILITEQNIHLYYKFMNDDYLVKCNNLLDPIFYKRFGEIIAILNMSVLDLRNHTDNSFSDRKIVIQKLFGVADSLGPIEKYVAEIEKSAEYKKHKEQM